MVRRRASTTVRPRRVHDGAGSRRVMKVATYNLNGVNGRLPRLLEWLRETRPDIVCLQEI